MSEHPGKAAAHRMLKEGGYAGKFDSKDIHQAGEGYAKTDVHRHEEHMHPGKPKTKLKAGGRVHGKKAKERIDRRARGGSIHRDNGGEIDDPPVTVARHLPGRGNEPMPTKPPANLGDNPGKAPKGSSVRLLARGGMVSIDQPDDADGNAVKDSARARGGHVGKKGKTVININAGGKEGGDPQHDQAVFQQGAQQGAKVVAQKMAAAGGGGPPRPPGAMPGSPPGMPPGGMPPGAGGPPPGAMPPPRPMMPPPGAGAPPPGMPMHARGGALRDRKGRFLGGSI